MTKEMLEREKAKHKKDAIAEAKKEMKKGKTKAEKKKILIDETNKFIRGEKCSCCGKAIKN